jgi:hypothetical protein
MNSNTYFFVELISIFVQYEIYQIIKIDKSLKKIDKFNY